MPASWATAAGHRTVAGAPHPEAGGVRPDPSPPAGTILAPFIRSPTVRPTTKMMYTAARLPGVHIIRVAIEILGTTRQLLTGVSNAPAPGSGTAESR